MRYGLTVAHLAVALTVAATTSASAHMAAQTVAQPQGWFYPSECCSGQDCRLLPARDVSETPEGYLISGTGEVVPYGDARLRDSPDGEFHWCPYGYPRISIRCLFVPPRSF